MQAKGSICKSQAITFVDMKFIFVTKHSDSNTCNGKKLGIWHGFVVNKEQNWLFKELKEQHSPHNGL